MEIPFPRVVSDVITRLFSFTAAEYPAMTLGPNPLITLGVAGVAWATFLCQGVSCLLAVVFVIRRLSAVRTEKPAAVFSWAMLGRIGVIAVPTASWNPPEPKKSPC